jgi:hypothetical protein
MDVEKSSVRERGASRHIAWGKSSYIILGMFIVGMNAHGPARCRMASWVVKCKNCEVEFTHSMIADDYTMSSYLWPLKPEFPEGGNPLECATCGNRATYQLNNLTNRA